LLARKTKGKEMFDISHILPLEIFAMLILTILGLIACWPANKPG
jgi:hypothetical protein